MASKKKPTREQALRVARYLGCSGAHQDEDGNWMPCSSHETLVRLSTEAEKPSFKPLEKVFRSLSGPRKRRYIRRNVPFNQFARDAEGDGIVQELTLHERPAATDVALAEVLLRLRDPDGGFTISASNMDDIKSGWAIARKGQGIKVSASAVFDKDGNVTEEGLDYLEAFLEMHRNSFLAEPTSRSRVALGAWHNPEDGQIYFDVTDVFAKESTNLQQALQQGKSQDQISIADLDELHAAIADGKWDEHVAFHNTGGTGRVVVPDEKFKPFLEQVRRWNEEENAPDGVSPDSSTSSNGDFGIDREKLPEWVNRAFAQATSEEFAEKRALIAAELRKGAGITATAKKFKVDTGVAELVRRIENIPKLFDKKKGRERTAEVQQELSDMVREMLEKNEPIMSQADLVNYFGLAKDTVRRLVNKEFPEYFDLHAKYKQERQDAIDIAITEFEEQGMSLAERANRLGLTVNQVSKIRSRLGFPPLREIDRKPKRVVQRGGVAIPVSEARRQDRQVESLYKRGLSAGAIAQRVGLPIGTVTGIVRALQERGNIPARAGANTLTRENRVIDLLAEGFSPREIVTMGVNIPFGRIVEIADELGIDIPPMKGKSARESVELRKLAGKKRRRFVNRDWENLGEQGVLGIDTLPDGSLVSGKTIIIGRARPRIGDPDVFTDPNAARLRSRKLGCIGIARRETPDGEVVWTPCTNVSDQRRREGESPLGRRDEMRRFADRLQEVGGPAMKRRRMRKYKSLSFSVDVKSFQSLGGILRSPMRSIGRSIGSRGKCGRLTRGVRSIRDGDGDGFICNPATGEDDLPIVGNNSMLRRFYEQLLIDKQNWKAKLKANPFNADKMSLNTPNDDADEMLSNLRRRGWLIKLDGNTVKLEPPPEFRKRYLAIRALKGEGAVDSIDGPNGIFAIGYHKWHPGNDPIGPEKEIASKMLKNFGYDPLHDTLYSPYFDTPRTYEQIADSNKIRKFALGVIPEFEGAPNAQPYLTDRSDVPEFKKPSIIDRQLERDIAKQDKEQLLNIYKQLVEAGQKKYGSKNKDRAFSADAKNVDDELNDFLALNDAGYGYDEIAEILNLEESTVEKFMLDEGYVPSKGRMKENLDAIKNQGKKPRSDRSTSADSVAKPRYMPDYRPNNFGKRNNPSPPKLDAIKPNKNINDPIEEDEFVDALKWMVYQDNQFRPEVRKDFLARELDANPRLSIIVQAINPTRWMQITRQQPEITRNDRRALRAHELMARFFEGNIDKIIDRGNLPQLFKDLNVSQRDLKNIMEIIASSKSNEEAQRRLSQAGLLNLYKDLHWIGLLPLLKDAPVAMQRYLRRVNQQRVPRKSRWDNSFEEKGLGAKTPAKPSERVFGSSRNPKGSASSTSKGSSISIDASTEQALQNKVKEHNQKMRDAGKPAWSMATLAKLKAVYRRGAGAFSVSHRPGMTRNQWAMGRVNAFLVMLRSGKPNSRAYVGDNDLLHREHPWKNSGVRQKSMLV